MHGIESLFPLISKLTPGFERPAFQSQTTPTHQSVCPWPSYKPFLCLSFPTSKVKTAHVGASWDDSETQRRWSSGRAQLLCLPRSKQTKVVCLSFLKILTCLKNKIEAREKDASHAVAFPKWRCGLVCFALPRLSWVSSAETTLRLPRKLTWQRRDEGKWNGHSSQSHVKMYSLWGAAAENGPKVQGAHVCLHLCILMGGGKAHFSSQLKKWTFYITELKVWFYQEIRLNGKKRGK